MIELKWSNGEIRKLFSCVEKSKENNKSLTQAFREFAKKNNRKPNSVRNYYYEEVSNLKNNEKRLKELKIDISKHQVLNLKKFSSLETKSLVKEILKQKCMGVSTRKACLILASNDIQQMIRFQNKFRSVIKNDKNLYNECLQELKNEGLKPKDNSPNVVYMQKQNNRLSDEDVNSLFLGLIKLVKKTAIEDVSNQLSSEAEFANTSLRKSLSKLAQSEKEIKNYKTQLENKNREVNLLKEENCFLKTKIAQLMGERLIRSTKSKSLVSYLKDLREKGSDVKTRI